MGALVSAIGFLTRLPVPSRASARAGTGAGAGAFGLVGAGLGAIGAVPLLVAAGAPLLAAFLAVGLLAVASGWLHLDGLADTADALAAPDPARADAARRDPRSGPAGVAALVIVIGVQVGALVSLLAVPSGAFPALGGVTAAVALVAATAASRATPVLVAVLGSRRGTASRLGTWFASSVTPLDAALATVGAAAALGLAAAVGGLLLAASLAIGAALGLLAAALLVRARGGIDGDVLGAGVEAVQAASLALAAMAVTA